MKTFQPTSSSKQAYIQRMVRAQQPRAGVVFGAGRLVRESGGLGAEFLRHAFMVIGVAGLVGIAVGATTECHAYNVVLNWVTSLFV